MSSPPPMRGVSLTPGLPSGSGSSTGVQALWVERLLEAWSQTPCRISGDNPSRDCLWWLAIAAARYPGCESRANPSRLSLPYYRFARSSSPCPPSGIAEDCSNSSASGSSTKLPSSRLTPSLPSPHSAIAALAGLMEDDLDWGTQRDQHSSRATRKPASAMPPAVYLPVARRILPTFRRHLPPCPSFLATSALRSLPPPARRSCSTPGSPRRRQVPGGDARAGLLA